MPRPRLVVPSALLMVVALVPALGPAAPGLAAATGEVGQGQATAGEPIDQLSPTLQTTDRLDDRHFVVAGDRAYDVGTEAGRYPGMGFHTRGEMSGVWTPPLKLLDGLWFGLDGDWIGPATRFVSGYGYAQLHLPGPAGVDVLRTDFVPDGGRAVVVGLTFRNTASARRLSLRVDAHSELMGAYP